MWQHVNSVQFKRTRHVPAQDSHWSQPEYIAQNVLPIIFGLDWMEFLLKYTVKLYLRWEILLPLRLTCGDSYSPRRILFHSHSPSHTSNIEWPDEQGDKIGVHTFNAISTWVRCFSILSIYCKRKIRLKVWTRLYHLAHQVLRPSQSYEHVLVTLLIRISSGRHSHIWCTFSK